MHWMRRCTGSCSSMCYTCWCRHCCQLLRVAGALSCLGACGCAATLALLVVFGTQWRTDRDAVEQYVALIQGCWEEEPSARPPFKDIVVRLRQVAACWHMRIQAPGC